MKGKYRTRFLIFGKLKDVCHIKEIREQSVKWVVLTISRKNQGSRLMLETSKEMSGKMFIFAFLINRFHNMLKNWQENNLWP